MNGRSFSLQPFSPIGPPLTIKITGHIIRRPRQLAIRYDLHGPLASLMIPAPAAVPARRHGLWQETCFEFFLGVKDSPRYWEFNLSPAGPWNVYRFAGYRRGMAEETAFTSLPFSVRRRSNLLQITLELEVERIVAADQPLEVGIAAVIKLAGGGLTYWALLHPGPEADFFTGGTAFWWNCETKLQSNDNYHVGQPPSAVHTLFRRRRGRLRYILMRKESDRDFRRGLDSV